ncbi:MAG: putative colanic acid biosynthesis acetyltransferase [Imperialibacter sp.]|uniref:putative colanic acid biosynthesis acetyltransferase n=1 Tax=Imperialibacter sp. TaxID=2038411 RepID=UPI0032EBE061
MPKKIITFPETNLSAYNNAWYKPGAHAVKRLLWYVTNSLFFINPLNPSSGLKVALLRLFGASVGRGVRINPSVNIKYPWLLEIGDYSWIGEKVWIDNLAKVTLGNNCCLSQGAMLLTGNHNYKKPTFDLMVSPIVLEEGVWIGAKATVCPGVTCHSHAVLAVGSVATKDLEAFGIYQGNPAVKVKERKIGV